MDITTEVRPGANRYASGANILQNLPSYLADFKKISVITGEKSSEAFKNTIARNYITQHIVTMAVQATKTQWN